MILRNAACHFGLIACCILVACSDGPAGTTASTAAPTASTTTIKPLETIAPLPTTMETFRALAPPEGLKLTPLFNAPVSDEAARMKRVEDAVQTMRDDFDTVMPSMVRMVAMEKNLRELVTQLQTLNGQTAATGAMPTDLETLPPGDAWEDDADLDDIDTVEEETAVKPPEATEPASLLPADLQTKESRPDPAPALKPLSGVTIKAIRVGDHGAVTRLVVDMSDNTELPVSFQNDGKQMSIDLTGLAWAGKNAAPLHSVLVSGYHVDGDKILIDLTRPGKLKTQQILPPGEGAGYRTVIDMVAQP